MLTAFRKPLAVGSLLAPCLLVACSVMESSSDSEDTRTAAIDGKPTEVLSVTEGAVVEPAVAPQQSTEELERQKLDLMIEEALQRADGLIERGELEKAQAHLEGALGMDPENEIVTQKLLEVGELLGESGGTIAGVRQRAEARARARAESMRLEAEDAYRQAEQAIARGDFADAIRHLERVNESIRWSGDGIDWGQLPARTERALADARTHQERAAEKDRQSRIQEAYDKIRADEAAADERRRQQIAAILERGAHKFDRGDYEAAESLANEVLTMDPQNPTAVELRDMSVESRRSNRADRYVSERKEAYRRWMTQIEELRIPYSSGLTPAPDDYWARVQRRTAVSELGITTSGEDERIRASLKSIRIPSLEFNDDDINAVTGTLQTFSGIPILASSEVVAELDSSGDLITLPTVTNLSVESILNIISANLGEDFSWTVRDGVVLFTTAAESFGETIIRVHPVQDLTFSLTNFKGPELDHIPLPGEYGDEPETSVFAADLEGEVITDPAEVVDLIRNNVERESWDLDDRFSIDQVTSNQLLVIHTPEVQAKVAAFLDDLRGFSSTVVEIESRFIEHTDAFIQEIGSDLRGLGNTFGTDVNLDDTTSSISGQVTSSQGLDNLGGGVAGSTSPSAGAFFNDNSDGDIRARTENFFANPLGNVLSTVGGGAFQISLLDDTEVNLVLNLVEKSVNATEIMAPILTVFNTQRAYVTVINEISFLQDFDVDVASTAFIANPEVGILQEGVVLDVRPTISYDRKYVNLEVRTTVADVQRPIETFETTLGGFTDPVTFQIPRVSTQNANTTVVVPDGGTVLLGGLTTIRHINREATSPWLGKIPLVNFLFKEKGVVDEVVNLAIVVRANIRDLSPYRESNPLR